MDRAGGERSDQGRNKMSGERDCKDKCRRRERVKRKTRRTGRASRAEATELGKGDMVKVGYDHERAMPNIMMRVRQLKV